MNQTTVHFAPIKRGFRVKAPGAATLNTTEYGGPGHDTSTNFATIQNSRGGGKSAVRVRPPNENVSMFSTLDKVSGLSQPRNKLLDLANKTLDGPYEDQNKCQERVLRNTQGFNDFKVRAPAKKSLNGIDNSFDHVLQLLSTLLLNKTLDLAKHPLGQRDIQDLSKQMGVYVSPFQASEALYFARQCSQESANFRLDLLAAWFSRNLPILRPSYGGKRTTMVETESEEGSRKRGSMMLNPYESSGAGGGHTMMSTTRNRTFYADMNFKTQIHSVVKQIEQLPQLRKNIYGRIQEWSQEREKAGAALGMRGARQARKDVKEYFRRREEGEEKLLQKFLDNEPNACHASNLYRLLTKKWNEDPTAYKICSKLTPRKEKRVKEILVENRYSS